MKIMIPKLRLSIYLNNLLSNLMIPCWYLSRPIFFNTVNQSSNFRWQVYSFNADTPSLSAPSAGWPLQYPWKFRTLETTKSPEQSSIQTNNARARRRRRRRWPFRHGKAKKKNSLSNPNSRSNFRSSLFYFYYTFIESIFYFLIEYLNNLFN